MALTKLAVVTLFPEEVKASLGFGVVGRAIESGLVDIRYINPREFSGDERGTVDDRPAGGGPGMVMLAEPLEKALDAAAAFTDNRPVWYLTPQGKPVTQGDIERIGVAGGVTLLCGRYEGVDERLLQRRVDHECSLGDIVVSGGEFPAAMVIDAAVRMVPGALGKMASAEEDSFVDGLLDCPHFARPDLWQGLSIPQVLKAGHHGQTQRWRRQQALGRTWLRRPDLLVDAALTKSDKTLLSQFIEAYAREGDTYEEEHHNQVKWYE